MTDTILSSSKFKSQDSKICVICGNVFYRTHSLKGKWYDDRWSKRKYCSNICVGKGKTLFFPRKKANRKKYSLKCCVCNKSFLSIYPKQQTCSYRCSNYRRWGHTNNNNDRIESVLNNIKITSNECFEYQGYLNQGYGHIHHLNKDILVHRLSYEVANNIKIPEGLCVCHKCDNPACINPEHLFLGTLQDNMTDSKNKGRKFKKLSFEKIEKILSMIRCGIKYKSIGDRFEISESTVSTVAIKNGIRRCVRTKALK